MGGSVLKSLPANARGVASIPGLGRSPEGRNGNPLQYSFPGKAHGQRNLVSSQKIRTRLKD